MRFRAVMVAFVAASAMAADPPPASDRLLVDRAELDALIDNALKAPDEKKKTETTQPADEKQPPKLTPIWRDGIWFETQKKDFKLHFGGTFHYDFGWYTADEILETGPGGVSKFNDGANLRRGRMKFQGTIFEHIDFDFTYEFSNGFRSPGLTVPPSDASVWNSPGPTECYVNFREVPFLSNIRVGNQKEWFGLEHLASHRWTEFMERSPLNDFSQISAFNNGYSPGIATFRSWCDERVFTGAGVYKNVSDITAFGINDGQYAVTTRIVGLPIYEDDGAKLLHLGTAFSHRDPVNDQVRLRARDSVRAQPFPLMNILVDTGQIAADSHDLVGIEAASVWGPITLQSEYIGQWIHDARVGTEPSQGTLYFQGWYVQALVFLTGEHRPYHRRYFTWERIRPLSNFVWTDGCHGIGAWELGVRYSYLDVSDGTVAAGRLDDITVGLNWYLNPNTKVQFNYDIAIRGDVPTPAQGVVQAFGVRMALDF